jgi:methionine-rich copper-binding protein CopC
MLLLGQECWAQAFVDHAEPAVGRQIQAAPFQVKMWFTERLEPALSKIRYLIPEVFEVAGW